MSMWPSYIQHQFAQSELVWRQWLHDLEELPPHTLFCCSQLVFGYHLLYECIQILILKLFIYAILLMIDLWFQGRFNNFDISCTFMWFRQLLVLKKIEKNRFGENQIIFPNYPCPLASEGTWIVKIIDFPKVWLVENVNDWTVHRLNISCW